MNKLNSIRVQNLRSLKDTGFINLKPLTILVGRNSVGKSTFARTFPLIRQSCEAQKKSPVLWYGRLVDFGDFKTALNKGNAHEGISFSFKFISSYLEYSNIFVSNPLVSSDKKRSLHFLEEKAEDEFENEISITISNFETKDPQYNITIKFLNDVLKLILKPKSQKIYAIINNNTYEIDDYYKIEQQQFFPNIELDIRSLRHGEKDFRRHLDFYVKNRNFIFPILLEKKYKDYSRFSNLDKIINLLEKSLFEVVDQSDF